MSTAVCDMATAALVAADGASNCASGMCPSCECAMEIQNDEYVCPKCGRITTHTDGHLSSDVRRVRRDGASMRVRASTVDPLREQHGAIFEWLVSLRETFVVRHATAHDIVYAPGSLLTNVDAVDPRLVRLVPCNSVIDATVNTYISMQRKSAEKGTPFVKCGSIKHELIASIMYLVCQRIEQRGKRDIAEMLGLRTDGFSRGHGQLRIQLSEGHVAIDDDDTLRANKVRTIYRATLGAWIDAHADDYRAMSREIRELVHVSHERAIFAITRAMTRFHLCVRCRLQSKFVGVVWFVARAMGYGITTHDIDVLSGGIKRGTFIRPALMVKDNAHLREIACAHMPHLRNSAHFDSLRL